MKNSIFALFCFIPVFSFCQTVNSPSAAKKESKEEMILKWLVDLNDKGIELTEDSIKIGKEFQKVLLDENYRSIIYPKLYTWEQTVKFIEVQDLKKAFWYLINLYPANEANKALVLKSVLAYDQLFKMDEIMVNTFYTYCYLDPEVSIIKEGKPETIHPDILESKLRNVKEIVGYVLNSRKQKTSQIKN